MNLDLSITFESEEDFLQWLPDLVEFCTKNSQHIEWSGFDKSPIVSTEVNFAFSITNPDDEAFEYSFWEFFDIEGLTYEDIEV